MSVQAFMPVRAASNRECTIAIEKPKYIGVVFTIAGRRTAIDTRIVKANSVLCEQYRSVETKRELSNTAKLSVFISVFVRIFTYMAMNLGY